MVATRRARSGAVGALTGPGLGIHVPVAHVGILALATFLAVGTEGVQVVFMAMGAGVGVLVVIAPGVLQGSVLDVTALAPVADGGVGGLLDQRFQPLVGGRVLEVIQAVQGERRAH